MKKLAIVGGGAASLMLAAHIDTQKYDVSLYEKNKAVGRKFLVAGEGGLNLTYSASLEDLVDSYHPSEFMRPIITKFTNEALIAWFNKHEISTFVGSSSRVFPDFKYKPIEVLNKIVERVAANKVRLELSNTWLGWNDDGHLRFEDKGEVEFDIVVFALGGASWKVTGSDGTWDKTFADRGINVLPFRAANCAFGIAWDKIFKATHSGKPLKNISLSYDDQISKGELVITEFGLEGNAIYALSQKLQEDLLNQKSVTVYLDLKPTMTSEQIKRKYNRSQLTKTTAILKKDLNLNAASIGILKQFTDREVFMDVDLLAAAIKAIPVVVDSAGDLDKAISSLGGVALDEIDENFQLKKIHDTYVIGEMLDWYAPTGGYLLQGCFSMGAVLAAHLNKQ